MKKQLPKPKKQIVQTASKALKQNSPLKMDTGYLYCISNPYMPGILKVGITKRSPDERLKEANSSDTWRLPAYKIEFAKKVLDPCQKEKVLHKLLEQYTLREHPRREWFRVSKEEVHTFFDLMDGEMWVKSHIEEEEEDKDEDENEEEEEEQERETTAKNDALKTRKMDLCFTNGQRIRHVIGVNKIWMGKYDSSKDAIEHNGEYYKSMSRFASTHYSIDHPGRTSKSANGWKECECEINGSWVSTYCLKKCD